VCNLPCRMLLLWGDQMIKITLWVGFAFSFLLLFCHCDFLTPTKSVYLHVVASYCNGCALCLAVDQGHAITLVNEKAIIDPSRCIQCAKCVEICPYDAIY
jgi:Pyruvate/2-oxoacid:ferredoxin oxidoreductase delta subunit